MTMDIAATILAAIGVTAPTTRPLDGIDLLPVLRGGRIVDRTLFWRIDRTDRKQKAARQGKWKYVRDGSIEVLFDLSKDLGERNDVGRQFPERVAELRKAMSAWESELAKTQPPYYVK
jgi:arylsulfatase A-like enzyme